MKKSNFQKNPGEMLNLWERLELRFSRDDGQARFITRVEDLAKGAIIVEKPVRISGSLKLEAGSQVEAIYNRDDASYMFMAVITSIDASRGDMMTLQAITELERTQRRRFVRLDIVGEVTLKNIELNEVSGAEIGLTAKGELLNISAGGILIGTGARLKKDGLVLLNFRLKDSQRLENIIGLVKRWEESTDAGEGKVENLAGIEFLTKDDTCRRLSAGQLKCLPSDINYFDEALQQAVVQFIYRQQVENRKKAKVKA